MKVLTVFGTRPEAIKLAPVVRALEARAADSGVHSVVCVTAQHRQMLDQVLDLFELRPDYDLAVMEENQTLAGVAAAVLARLEPVLRAVRPDWVLVQGDTTTVAATALAAYYAGARVGHVEAGLRTGDKWRPFPEEINRRVAGVVADRHFAPTARAQANLLREGVAAGQIVVTGNPVLDALRRVVDLPPPEDARAILAQTGLDGAAPQAAASAPRRLVLVTAHRRESFGAPLEAVCAALRDLAARYAGAVQVVYAVHPNPHVREPAYRLLDGVPNVTLTPPLTYSALAHLMKRAALVLTDSGGIQEEAPGLGVPVLVLRDVTERPEAVEAGTVRLVGTDRGRIVAAASQLLDDPAAYARMARAVNPYGDGHAAPRIVAALLGEPVEPFRPEASRTDVPCAAAYGGSA
ncbi:MAG TPA: UDP-N-acetylglucosamine 2-epimerase (non-hydrolyzing) [Chloroflexota bacterium]|nr:UDP-N-acetylglucosamine 2-epimerase (non-hydrolyzing) [Chloroflexota bacterium]